MSMTGLVNDHASAYPAGGGTRPSAGTAVTHQGSWDGWCSTSVPDNIRTPACRRERRERCIGVLRPGGDPVLGQCQVGIPERGGHDRGRLQREVTGEHLHLVAVLGQPDGTGHPGDPGSDHDDSSRHATHRASMAGRFSAREDHSCPVSGRLRGAASAHLPMATRVLMLKSDGSVLVHSDGGSYKPLNWMSPPCTVREGTTEDGQVEWTVAAKSGDSLRILIEEVLHDSNHDLGVDPGLQKDGVEKHLQELLAGRPATLGEGLSLVRREFPTAIGPVDLMCRDTEGRSVAVEIKRRRKIDGVEQLTRYLELLNRDPLLRPVRGIFAAPRDQAAGAGARRRPRHRLRDHRLRRTSGHGRHRGPALLAVPGYCTAPPRSGSFANAL